MLDRRQFLLGAATVLAVAAGCTRPPSQEPPQQAGGVPAAVPDEAPRPFRVALLSDPHTVAEDSNLAGAINGKLADAVADYEPLQPDLWLVNGDIADHGLASELSAFRKVMAKGTGPEQLLVNTGNHDFYDREASDEEELRRFCEAFGLETPYSHRVAGGLHFVMLATEQYKSASGPREWAWLTPEQLRWFEGVLAAHKDVLTVVCLHQPLQETVIWSHGGNDFAGCGQVAELRALLEQNPQVKLWFSGHTHMGPEIAGNVAHIDGVTYVGLGSTFYQFVPSDAPEAADYGGFRKDLSVNQSRMMEVWPDRLVLRARDHVRRSWMEAAELVIKRI